MENHDFKNMLNEISDEDVTAAVKELKLHLNLRAEDLKKICLSACLHSRTRNSSVLSVRDAMTRDVLSVGKYDDISQVVGILADRNISGLPVVDRENHVVGIISEADVISMVGETRDHTFKDLVKRALGHHLPERKQGHMVGDIMNSPAVTIAPDIEISEAVRIMDERRIRRLPVVDKDKRLIGILSRADILKTIQAKFSAAGKG
ncbi:MAG: CBS domain-containing protein [Thermodesulfovibrionales bacterium]